MAVTMEVLTVAMTIQKMVDLRAEESGLMTVEMTASMMVEKQAELTVASMTVMLVQTMVK